MKGRGKTTRARRGSSRPKRRRILVYLLEVAICLAVLGSVGYAFAHYIQETPRFKVQRIRIEGARVLAPETIRAAAGITEDDNILLLQYQADTICQRVEGLPYVKSCTMRRSMPNLVTITVTEREALASLSLHHHIYEIDADAVVLRELDARGAHVGPLISGVPNLDFVEPGQRLEQPALLRALQLWHVFSSVPIVDDLTVSELAAHSENSISMYCDELPFEIRWGRSEFTRQAQRFHILMQEMDNAIPCTEYLDLRFDQDLVCK
jgi:cell division protein FtsQ